MAEITKIINNGGGYVKSISYDHNDNVGIIRFKSERNGLSMNNIVNDFYAYQGIFSVSEGTYTNKETAPHIFFYGSFDNMLEILETRLPKEYLKPPVGSQKQWLKEEEVEVIQAIRAWNY